MVKKFRRQKKTYSFVTARRQKSLSNQELAAYRKLFLAIVFLLVISILLYVKGLDFLIYYSSFWRQDTVVIEPTPTPKSGGHLVIPRINALPSAIKENDVLRITGSAPEGTRIVILVNDTEVKDIFTNAQGTFKTDIEDFLDEGVNKISALVIDNNKLRSKPAEAQIVILDTKPPKLIINSPQDQEVIETKTNVVNVSGETESTKITVSVNGYRAIVDLEGYFKYSLPLSKGDNKIKIEAEDEVGHKTIRELTVTYQPGQES